MVVSCSDSVSVPFLREFFEADTSVLVHALGVVGLTEPSLGETGLGQVETSASGSVILFG